MKISEDGKGKYIVDFEGLRVDIRIGASDFPLKVLFNSDVVSCVMNGNFQFTLPAVIPFGVEGT